MRLLPPVLTVLLLAGCTEPPRDEPIQPTPGGRLGQAMDRDRQAELEADVLDREIAAIEAKPAADRDAATRRLGSRFESFLADVTGTRIENKGLYLLASWRFRFARDRGDRGVEELLDRLDNRGPPGFKSAGRYLRVRLLLRQGRLAEARRTAESLVAEIPEARTALDLVAFHARVGSPPGRLTGTPIGQAFDPAAVPSSWLLYLFISGTDDGSLSLVQRWTEACADAKAVLVVVTADGSPLTGAQRLRQAGAKAILWASPGDNGDLKSWVDGWTLPMLPCAVLVSPGPERKVMAASPEPEDLAAIAGR
jgi:hypothetical protein